MVTSTDYLDVRSKLNATTSSSNYNPYYDVTGGGVITSTDYLDVRSRLNNTLPTNAPGPQDSGVGSLGSADDADLGGVMLAVVEGSTSQTGSGSRDSGQQPVVGQQLRHDGERQFAGRLHRRLGRSERFVIEQLF